MICIKNFHNGVGVSEGIYVFVTDKWPVSLKRSYILTSCNAACEC